MKDYPKFHKSFTIPIQSYRKLGMQALQYKLNPPATPTDLGVWLAQAVLKVPAGHQPSPPRHDGELRLFL